MNWGAGKLLVFFLSAFFSLSGQINRNPATRREAICSSVLLASGEAIM